MRELEVRSMTDLDLEVTYPANWDADAGFVKIRTCDLDELVKNAARYQYFLRNHQWDIRGDIEENTYLTLKLHGLPNCECRAYAEGAINDMIYSVGGSVEIKTYLNLEIIRVNRKE